MANLLRDLNYSCQANSKVREGGTHPDRDAQFNYIHAIVKEAIADGEPAISVDTKKKELGGDFKNNGKELRSKGQPEQVRTHDFKIPALGKVLAQELPETRIRLGKRQFGLTTNRTIFDITRQAAKKHLIDGIEEPLDATTTPRVPRRRKTQCILMLAATCSRWAEVKPFPLSVYRLWRMPKTIQWWFDFLQIAWRRASAVCSVQRRRAVERQEESRNGATVVIDDDAQPWPPVIAFRPQVKSF